MGEFNEESIDRLLRKLEKDFFNSLSYEEQTEVLDEFIDYSLFADNKTSIGIGSIDNITPISITDMVRRFGRNEFREMLRTVVIDGGFQSIKITRDDMENIANKLHNNEELSDDEQYIVDSIVNHINGSKDEESIQFTMYTYLRLMMECIAEDNMKSKGYGKDQVTFVPDLEPFAGSEFVFALGCCLADKNNALRKMFDKRGFDKMMSMVNDTTDDLTELVVQYSKDNNIAPERTLLALILLVRVMAGSLKMSIGNIQDKEQFIIEILTALEFNNVDEDKLSALINGSNINNSLKRDDVSSPNGEYKESKKDDNMDIRKLLLDD